MEDRVQQLEQQLQRQQQLGFALPNKFDDGDVVSWLDSFDVCAAANGWNNDTRLRRIPTLLVGRAFAIFQRLAAGQKDTLAPLREALVAAFLPEEQRGARSSEFDSASIKAGEAVEVFAHRLESLLRKALQALDGDAREAVLKQRFIRGMQPSIRLRLYENPALTYGQCVTTARQLQSAVKQLAEEGVPTPNSIDFGGDARPQMQTPAGHVKTETVASANLIRNAAARPNAVPGSEFRERQSNLWTCYNCGKLGHKSAQCLAPRADSGRRYSGNAAGRYGAMEGNRNRTDRAPLTCFSCGGHGHKQDVCPSKRSSQPTPRRQNVAERTQPSTATFGPRMNTTSSTRNTITGTEHFEYLVDAHVDGHKVSCLLDSGAANTFMSFQLFERLFPGRDYTRANENETVRAANSTTMRIRGYFSAELDFGSYKTMMKLTLLEDLLYDIVLGIGFFDRYVRCVRPGDLRMQLVDGTYVRFRRSGINKIQVTALVCSDTVTIMPQSKSAIPCAITESRPTSGLLCISDTAPLLERYGIIIPYGVFDPQTSTTPRIHVINSTCEPVVLHQGARIALLEECELIRQSKFSGNSYNSLNNSGSARNILLDDVHCDRSYLTGSECERLTSLLNEYADVFSVDGQRRGRTSLVEHRIDLKPGSKPFKLASRRVPMHLNDTVDKEIDCMLEHDVIEPSEWDFSSPPVIVRKKDGRIRFCVDYRRLNDITIKDNYPLPRIDDAMDSIGAGCRYFTTLDLAMGYYHVPIRQEDRSKTAFSTRRGLFQFKVMPFGLTNAPATFQRLMEKVLSRMNWLECLVYIDDVLVWSRTFDEHLDKLARIFKAFRDAGLKLKTSKCHIFNRQVKYLGHILGEDGLRMDPERIRAVQEIPSPRDKTELQSFLGLVNYYRRFLPSLTRVEAPLRDAVKATSFRWTPECEHAMQDIKDLIKRDLVLSVPVLTRNFINDTDASDRGFGAVLSQLDENSAERPVAFASRCLSASEMKYPVMEKECLALVWAVTDQFHPYVYGAHFLLRTDNQPLSWLKSLKDPSPRLARWILKLQEYDFDIQHRPGLKQKMRTPSRACQ